MKITAGIATVLASVMVVPADAATRVDLDGMNNASLFGTNAKTVDFAPGTYAITFVDGGYTALNRFGMTSGCDAAGARCTFGFENSLTYVIDGRSFAFGDGDGFGGLGPQATGGYFTTATQSLAHAAGYSTRFTLTAPASVGFYLFDDLPGDNRGGVSVLVTAVPEPATWLTMILGLGAIGWCRRRSRAVGGRVLLAW